MVSEGADMSDRALDNVRGYMRRLKTDSQTLERFKSDPIGELRNLGITIAAGSELERRLITCARNQTASSIMAPEDPDDPDFCYIVTSNGNCWIVQGGP